MTVPEAKLDALPEGLGAEGAGWFVLNARDARWWERRGLGRWADLEGDGDFEQLGMRIAVLEPGQPTGMYHGEAGQENFLVVSGECVLVIEGEERQLRAVGLRPLPALDESRIRRRRRQPVCDRHGWSADRRSRDPLPGERGRGEARRERRGRNTLAETRPTRPTRAIRRSSATARATYPTSSSRARAASRVSSAPGSATRPRSARAARSRRSRRGARARPGSRVVRRLK